MAPQASRIFCQPLDQRTSLNPPPVSKRLRKTGCLFWLKRLAATVARPTRIIGLKTMKSVLARTEISLNNTVLLALLSDPSHHAGIALTPPQIREHHRVDQVHGNCRGIKAIRSKGSSSWGRASSSSGRLGALAIQLTQPPPPSHQPHSQTPHSAATSKRTPARPPPARSSRAG